MDDPAAWNAQALETYQTDRDALDWYRTQGIYTVSIDEQTSIQARERIAADLLPHRGMLARREYESIRHGTLALFGNLHIATGKVLSAMIRVTRTEDSLENMDGLVCTNRATQWHFVTDNLNTHTNIITIHCCTMRNRSGAGSQDSHGILQSLQSRRDFLVAMSHRIRFVYTPKDWCSLNQTEIWFGTLRRMLTSYGSFSLIEDSRDRIIRLIGYYNKTTEKALPLDM